MDDAFHKDFSANAVFTTTVSGGDAAQTALSYSAIEADALAVSGGAEDGSLSDGSPSAKASDPICQPSTRSARHIAGHVATTEAPAFSCRDHCRTIVCSCAQWCLQVVSEDRL